MRLSFPTLLAAFVVVIFMGGEIASAAAPRGGASSGTAPRAAPGPRSGGPSAGGYRRSYPSHGRYSGHRSYHGSDTHYGIGIYWSGAFGPWYYPYPYYYPYYQPYPYYPYYGAPYYAPYPQYPTEWIERPDYAWYYCASLQAYYPYVTECPDGGWQRVEPHPPGAPQ